MKSRRRMQKPFRDSVAPEYFPKDLVMPRIKFESIDAEASTGRTGACKSFVHEADQGARSVSPRQRGAVVPGRR
jgi:hypothetical protein